MMRIYVTTIVLSFLTGCFASLAPRDYCGSASNLPEFMQILSYEVFFGISDPFSENLFYLREWIEDQRLAREPMVGKTKKELILAWGPPHDVLKNHFERNQCGEFVATDVESWWYGTHVFDFKDGKCVQISGVCIWH